MYNNNSLFRILKMHSQSAYSIYEQSANRLLLAVLKPGTYYAIYDSFYVLRR